MTSIHGGVSDITSSARSVVGSRAANCWRWCAVVAAMALGLAACSSTPTADEELPTTSQDAVSPDDGATGGGTLVLAVE